jgi:outer membrane receptor for Fe3+-dicitrate
MTHTFRTGSVTHTLDSGARFLTENARVQQHEGDAPDAMSGAVGLTRSTAPTLAGIQTASPAATSDNTRYVSSTGASAGRS